MHSRETIKLRNYVILTKKIEALENRGEFLEANKMKKLRDENSKDIYHGQDIQGNYKNG